MNALAEAIMATTNTMTYANRDIRAAFAVNAQAMIFFKPRVPKIP